MSISREDVKIALRAVMSETKLDELKDDIGDLKTEVAKVPGLIDTKIQAYAKEHRATKRFRLRTILTGVALLISAGGLLLAFGI
jgi:hypothetical protein